MRHDRRPAPSRPAPRSDHAPVRGGARSTPAAPEAADLAPPDVGPDADPSTLSPEGVIRLQRLAGNAAVRAYLDTRRPAVQRFLGFALGGFMPAHPELREGATGEAVRELQEKLSLATVAGGPLVTDGQFGPATRRRIRRFRAAHGLGTSPVADAALWTALDAAVAGLPAPVRPVLSVGSTGPDVALAQQKLNAFAGAGAALAIDGVFSAPMKAVVIGFQGGQHLTANGTIDAATWTALDRVSPGGGMRAEGGTPVEQHVLNKAGATSLGAPMAGTSMHVVVGAGGLRRGPAVREFQQKLNAWRATQALAPIGDDGRWGTDTRNATVAFQTATPGLSPATGVGDLPTWTALDAIAPTVAVGYRDRQWQEEVGGATYGMTVASGGGSRYAWEVRAKDIHVTSRVRFTGAMPPSAWFGHVRRAWNVFKAVKEGTNESLLIEFDMVAGGGGDSNAVQVVPPPTTGRANAGTWYVSDTHANETVPHEFGHLIGLRDEYQLHPGDFRSITGREPDVGSTAGPVGVTPQTIATNLRAAMMARSAPNAFAAVAGVASGAFAQQIVAAYTTLGAATVPAVPAAPGVAPLPAVPLTTNLVRDLESALVDNANLDKYNTIQVLTYSSGSLMGDSSRAFDPHDHGVQTRHVQEFVDVIQQVKGGRWHAELR